jgi:hypothetical protein
MSIVDRHSVAKGRSGFRVRLLLPSMSRSLSPAQRQQLPRPRYRFRRYGFFLMLRARLPRQESRRQRFVSFLPQRRLPLLLKLRFQRFGSFPVPQVQLLLLLLRPSVSMTPSSRRPQARQRARRYLLRRFVSFQKQRLLLHQRLPLIVGSTTSWSLRPQARRRVQALLLPRYGFYRARAPRMLLAQHQSPRSGLLLARLRQPLRRSSRRRTFSLLRLLAPRLLLRQLLSPKFEFFPAQQVLQPVLLSRRSSRRLMQRSSLRLPAAPHLRRHRFRQSRFFPARQQQPSLRRSPQDGLMTRFSRLRLLPRAVLQQLSPRSESCRVLPAEPEVRPFRSSPRGRAPSSFPLQPRGQQALLHRFRASPSFRLLLLEPPRPQFRLWRFSFLRLLLLQRAPGLFLRSTSQSKSRSLSRMPPPRLRLSPRSTSSPSTTSTYRLQAGARGTDAPWRSSSTRDPLAGVVSEPRRQPASIYRRRGK